VTGASRGIGAGIAERLAAEGARVALVARTKAAGDHALPGSLDEMRARIEARGGTAYARVADLSDAELDRARLVDEVEAALGPVDILVNNAAAAFYLPFLEISEKRFRITYEMNVRTPWLLAQRVLPGMIERRRGWILNISSAAALLPKGPPFGSAVTITRGTVYGSSKQALNRWTAGLAAEMYPHGIAVNALSPQASVLTPGAVAVTAIPEETVEPMETMVEAALALCTCTAEQRTGRIDYSLALLKELERPVYDLQGSALIPGWQPADIRRRGR
jgi:NAD(P)-dependent dehydrogenase (short-subunit alcohol dehydrogenase family)